MNDPNSLACCPTIYEKPYAVHRSGPATSQPKGVLQPWVRRRLLNRLQSVQQGRITFLEGNSAIDLGHPSGDGLTAMLAVRDPRFYTEIAFGGSLGFAEAYMQAQWTTDDLTRLLQILARNLDRLGSLNRGSAWCGRSLARLGHRLARNSRHGSRRNIASHYDLSNDFFATFLDPTMMYSSAKFEEPGMSLQEASIAKLEAICRRLDLQPNDHLIEIGTGWGGFALHAARHYGCHVTSTTISRQQYEYAQHKVEQAGLTNRITILSSDYRDLTGHFDKLVSIEMLEAVGHQYLDIYFAECNRLLRRGGRMVIQTITMPEQRYQTYLRSVDFIQKYIFPGGCLPSLAAIQQSVGRTGDLRLIDQEDFGHCYARTLREWRERFFDRLPEVRRLGFDERFVRMWEYYLCYCEAAFLERAVGVSLLTWVKSGRTV